MIKISNKACDEINRIMKVENKENMGIKISVKGGGCSGLSYLIDLLPEPEEGDMSVESNGVRMFIDLGSSLYLKGTVLDFSDGLNGKGFVFNNPNATRTCGCGQSFAA